MILPPKRKLGNVWRPFWLLQWEEELGALDATSIKWTDAMDAAKHPMTNRTAPQQRTSVSTAEIEKPHSRPMFEIFHLPLSSLVPLYLSF